MEVVCSDIYDHLGITKPPWPYVEGFVIFEVYYNPLTQKQQPPPDPLDVEGIYTYKGELPVPGTKNTTAGSGVSIEVVVYPAKSNAHILQ